MHVYHGLRPAQRFIQLDAGMRIGRHEVVSPARRRAVEQEAWRAPPPGEKGGEGGSVLPVGQSCEQVEAPLERCYLETVWAV